MTATIQAETGELLGLAVVFPSTPPPYKSMKALLVLTKAEAQARAEVFLKGLGAEQLTLLTDNPLPKEVVLVQPNAFWTEGNSLHRLPGPVRPAWLLLYKTGEHAGCLVYVDSETGAIIGGENAGSIAMSFPKTRTGMANITSAPRRKK